MKNDITEKELDRLLKGVEEPAPDTGTSTRILEMLDRRTGLSTAEKPVRTRRMSRRAWIAIAVAAVLTVSLGIGSIAYAENAEYVEAVAYFEENGLSTEGLTRAEIRTIYRDIKTQSFTYSEEGDRIVNYSSDGPVEGKEIIVDERPVADEFNEELTKMSVWDSGVYKYEFCLRDSVEDERGRMTDCLGGIVKLKYYSMVEWEYFEKGFASATGVAAEDGVYAGGTRWGENGVLNLPTVIKVSNDGEFLWSVTWGDDYDNLDRVENHIWCMCLNPDGGVTAFTTFRDLEYYKYGITVTKISPDGEIIFSTFNQTDNIAISSACAYPFDGGYLAKMWDVPRLHHVSEQFVVRINPDGTIANAYCFSENGWDYYIEDIAETDDRVYVSVTAVNAEAAAGLEPLKDEKNHVPDEDFAPYVDGTFSALLFIIDRERGEMLDFYEVKGAFGAGIAVEDTVDWQVKRLVKASFDMLFCNLYRGTAAVWNYQFSKNGVFISCGATGSTCAMH